MKNLRQEIISNVRRSLKHLSASEAQLHALASLLFTGYEKLSINHSSKYKRFVIVSQGRTGSSLLSDLLDQHPLIRCQSELLNHKVYFPLSFIQGMSVYYADQCWGFKLKPTQLTNRQKLDAEVFLKDLSDKGFMFIHLTRSNIARRTLSALVGYSRKTYHKLEQNQCLQPVSIKPELFLSSIKHSLQSQEEENFYMQKIDCLRLVYEQDLLSPEAQETTFKKILDFLELPNANHSIKSNFMKVSSSNLYDDIENFDELLHHLQQHQLFWAIAQLID